MDTKKEPKRLYRSRTENSIAGVCGGIAKYLNIDPVIVRAFFILVLMAGGSSIIAYIILWIAMPLEPKTK